MNKNEFLKNLESKDIIQLIEKEGTRQLVFTEKNKFSSIEKRHHHKNIHFNCLDDFVVFANDNHEGETIYSFKENKIYHTQNVKLEMGKSELKIDVFVPVRTEETEYWSKQSENNLKKFLNKLSLVADKDKMKEIRLLLTEFEISERTDVSNEAMFTRVCRNTLKKLPEVLTISFNPYMFIDDFKIEMDIYIEWITETSGVKSVKWDFESSLIKNLFYEHLKSDTELTFVVGDFQAVDELFVSTIEHENCKSEEGVPFK